MTLPDVPPWAAQPPDGAPSDDMIAARFIDDDAGNDPYFDPPLPAWAIIDDSAAEWAMAKAANAHAEIETVKDQAHTWIEQVKAWAHDAARRAQSTLGYFEGRLEQYALTRRAGDDKAATLLLPSGVVRTRRNSRKAVLVDEPAVIAWAKTVHGPTVLGDEGPGLLADSVVKRTEKIMLTELRDFVEIVDVHDGYVVTFEDDRWMFLPIELDDDGKPRPDARDLTARQVGEIASVEVHTTATVMYQGQPVPGMTVEHETITASVTPARKEITR